MRIKHIRTSIFSKPERARQCAEEALAKAEALGHVWLEARLLRLLHERTGQKQYAERCHALVSRIADGLDAQDEKRRLVDAWAAPLDPT